MLGFWVGFFAVDGSIVASYLVRKDKCETHEKALTFAKSNHQKWYHRGLSVDLDGYILVDLPKNIDDARGLALDSNGKDKFLWFEETV